MNRNIEIALVDNNEERFPSGAKIQVELNDKFLAYQIDTPNQEFDHELAMWKESHLFQKRIIVKDRIGSISIYEEELENQKDTTYSVVCHTDIKHCFSFTFDRLKKANAFMEILKKWRFDL